MTEKTPEERERILVNTMLTAAYNEFGIQRWWQRPRVELNGRTPQEAWDDGYREIVIELARRLRM